MDYQILFNITIGIIGTIGGWFLKTFYGSIRELQKADFRLNEEIHKVSLLIAGDCAKQSDVEKIGVMLDSRISAMDEKIEKRLEKMEEKLEARFIKGGNNVNQ